MSSEARQRASQDWPTGSHQDLGRSSLGLHGLDDTAHIEGWAAASDA
jgi:hypothetical protein